MPRGGRGHAWSLLVLLCILRPSLQATASAATRPAAVAATARPVACGTAGGIDVRGTRLALHGNHTYAHVCVLGGGQLLAAAALTVRTGLLYVDASSSIVADGLPGGQPKTVDCERTGTGKPRGAPGMSFTIFANRATVLGRIAANGGTGYDGTPSPCTTIDGGNGGDGGQITLEAANLTLRGSIAATGGQGGDGFTPDPLADQFFPKGGRAGSGGDGGHITLLLARPSPPRFAPSLRVAGGAPGTPGDDTCVADGTCKTHGYPGRHGRPGRIVIGTLSTAQMGALPSPTP